MLIAFDYLFKKFNINSNGVLHCGASSGQEAETYAAHGIKNVIWVEAIPSVFEQLNNHVKDYPGTITINACLSDTDGEEVEFNISNNEAQSSSFLQLGHHKIIHPTVEYIDKIKMKTVRADTLLKGIDMSAFDFLNIDVQGAELKVLKGMGNLLHNFKWAYIEVNFKETYVGCAIAHEIDEYLYRYGFSHVETSEIVAETWADAFFVKHT